VSAQLDVVEFYLIAANIGLDASKVIGGGRGIETASSSRVSKD
jgi:hypothetical protein